MIKKSLSIIFIILFLNFPCAASDFREAEWGMSKEQVKSLEKTLPIYYKNETLTYRGKVANIQVHIIYTFTDDKLKTGAYTFIANYVNNNVYLKDYERINDFLDLKYGQPEIRKELWNNELFKDKKGYYGNAISIGHLTLESTWNIDKTIIVHKLSGNNNIIEHTINYYDKNWIDNESKNKEINEIKGL